MPVTKELNAKEMGNWKSLDLYISLSAELLHNMHAPVLTQVPQPGLVANADTLEGHLHRKKVWSNAMHHPKQ